MSICIKVCRIDAHGAGDLETRLSLWIKTVGSIPEDPDAVKLSCSDRNIEPAVCIEIRNQVFL